MTSTLLILANSGTPLMWASGMHLLLGNALIGVLEGWLLARLFKFRLRSAIVVMIPANYLSCAVGFFGVPFLQTAPPTLWFDTPPLHVIGPLHVAALFAAYLATVVLEWPLCRILTRGSPAPNRRAWRASLVAQTASYALLVPFYASCSQVSLLTVPELQSDLSFVKSPEAQLYFIALEDGAVWRMRLDGTGRERCLDAHLMHSDARLFVKPEEQGGRFELWGVSGDAEGERGPMKACTGVAAPRPREDAGPELGTSRNFNAWGPYRQQRSDLRPPDEQAWTALTGFFAGEGLHVLHNDQPEYSLALETPLTRSRAWTMRNAVFLPGDQVVFQTADQILLLDMPTRRLAILTMGRGPVVALPVTPATSQPATRPAQPEPGPAAPPTTTTPGEE